VPVVSNSSPLIALQAIDRLPLFQHLFESILIPTSVKQEIRRSISVLPPWIREQEIKSPLPAIVLRNSLGNGEQEAIALALEMRTETIVLDDLPARRTAHAAGLNVIGTIGILLAAKRRGFIGNVRSELDNLIQASFFISPDLYAEVLAVAGEATR
jgi:predicted nucleic acid-binding protein